MTRLLTHLRLLLRAFTGWWSFERMEFDEPYGPEMDLHAERERRLRENAWLAEARNN
jgi:hypothetical protein